MIVTIFCGRVTVFPRIAGQRIQALIEDLDTEPAVGVEAIHIQEEPGDPSLQIDGRGNDVGLALGFSRKRSTQVCLKITKAVALPAGDADAVALLLGPGTIPEERLSADILETLPLNERREIQQLIAMRRLEPAVLGRGNDGEVGNRLAIVKPEADVQEGNLASDHEIPGGCLVFLHAANKLTNLANGNCGAIIPLDDLKQSTKRENLTKHKKSKYPLVVIQCSFNAR